MIRIKRIYDAAEPGDGIRILVDRLWPRGISKEKAAVDEWMKELAPSDDLRKWFGHDPERWEEFRSQYRRELQENREMVDTVRSMAKDKTVTLVFAARDQEHNNAIVLQELLSSQGSPAGGKKMTHGAHPIPTQQARTRRHLH